uniref:Uncharacterized protein n=1 Tax=Panagrolaimus sp. ES5 TaxID=591445 RepID=A0AC34GGN0_9BILA
MDTVSDGFILATDLQLFRKNDFGRRLSEKINKPVLNFDIRSHTRRSINLCGEYYENNNDAKFVVAIPTPGAVNICVGEEVPILTAVAARVSNDADVEMIDDSNEGIYQVSTSKNKYK